MKRIHIAVLCMMCLLLAAIPAQARQAMGVHAKIVDGIFYVPDYSGSMLMTYGDTSVKKIDMAKQAITRLNAKTPSLGYQAAVTTLSPNKTVYAPGEWKKPALTKAVQKISTKGEIFGRTTPMERNLAELNAVLVQLPQQTALVMVSDGCENLGGDPVVGARALYAANPGLTMHFVSVADNAKGAANLKALAALNPKSLLVDARDIIDTDEAALDFARTAFYNETIPNQEVVSLHEVLFDVAKYTIKQKYAKQLDELAKVMVTRPELKIFIEGFADPSGDFTRNLRLSENRANAVRDYLASKGVKTENLIIKGHGELDRYPSYMLDRRVEIMIITQ